MPEKKLSNRIITHKLSTMTMKLSIAILGSGRMGREIKRCIDDSSDLELAGIWSRSNRPNGLSMLLSDADIAIDFTLPEATEDIIRAVVDTHTPLVCGVSGLPEMIYQAVVEAGDVIPVLYDRNMSLGIAIMRRMVEIAGKAFGDRFEAEIHETHHAHKIDAPSGTALLLGEALAASRGQDFAENLHYDPQGNSQPRRGQIAFTVERRGEVHGEHTVVFANSNESLTLEHKVNDRRVFAEGALRAARWLVGRGPGFYSMQDVVR
jgi:4-hydroxy-tetrahydrodipicolinate reductase